MTGNPSLDEFIARARELHRRDALDTAAAAALHALRSADVDAILLKGPALARRLYAADEIRGYSDIDLLIPPRTHDLAAQALTELGFVRGTEVFGIDDVAGIQRSEVWTRPGGGYGPTLIDLHWRLDGCEAPDDVFWDALASGRGSIELKGQRAPVLGDEGLALHVALHAAQHGPDDVKALGDLSRAIERWPFDLWRRAAQLADTVEAVPALAAGLRLLPDGAALAIRLGLPPQTELDWKIRSRAMRPRGTFHLRAMAEATGLRGRANVLRRSLFPNPRWIRWEYPWAAHGPVRLALAYARHILRTPLWAARAARYLGSARRVRERD